MKKYRKTFRFITRPRFQNESDSQADPAGWILRDPSSPDPHCTNAETEAWGEREGLTSYNTANLLWGINLGT